MVELLLLEAINGLAGTVAWIDAVVVFLTKYGWYVLGAVIVLLRKQLPVAVAVGGVPAGLLVERLIQLVWQRPRPFVAHEVTLLVEHVPSPGFPSSHAIVSFALAQAVWFASREWGVAAFVFAVLLALSRVFVGVHYVSDVAVGAVIGVVSSCVVCWFVRRLE